MKILVIGAGPAGLSAAMNASKEGNEVQVFEKNSAVCSKICGEALGREALKYVDIKPSREFIIREVKGFRLTFKGMFIKEAPFGNLPNAPGYLINKPLFLNKLLNEAEKNGAKFFFDSRVEAVDPKTAKIRLHNGQIVQGDLVLCADGSGSIARSHLDYSEYNTATCLQSRCSMPEELSPEYLHLDIIGEGYAWTFIKNDCANIGIGLQKNSCSLGSLKLYLDKYMKRLGAKPLSRTMSAPVSTGGPLKSFGTRKIVVVGEAAGCVMPLSGEGNRFAIYGGSIACKPDYRARFMKKYGKNMELSRKIVQLVKNLNDNERIDFLKCLSDPLGVLEGKMPRIGDFIFKPALLVKLMHRYLS